MTSFCLESRIIELTFAPWETLPGELSKLGLKCELQEDGGSLLVRNEQMGIGIINTDPTTKAVLLAFILCGPVWGAFFPQLLEKVDIEWKKRRAKV